MSVASPEPFSACTELYKLCDHRRAGDVLQISILSLCGFISILKGTQFNADG